MSVDPLAEIVTLLQPRARFSKFVEAAGPWRVHRRDLDQPFYCAVLTGECRMSVDGGAPMTIRAGDFMLVPAMHDLINASLDGGNADNAPTQIADGHFRVGRLDGPAEITMWVGHCSFDSPDAALLVPLLPQVVHVRGVARLVMLMEMIVEETRARRPAREVMLERLLEALLIEALRCGGESGATPGLARGLADKRLAAALRALHARPDHAWTVAALAAEAALSRSAFFTRFSRAVGVAPMAYLAAWRMALAKRLLRDREIGVEQVAERVGYRSASTFSVAFSRHAGMPPARYARLAQAR